MDNQKKFHLIVSLVERITRWWWFCDGSDEQPGPSTSVQR
jgi:hypothetical protein